MYREKHIGFSTVWCQASTGGLVMYLPWIRGDFYTPRKLEIRGGLHAFMAIRFVRLFFQFS